MQALRLSEADLQQVLQRRKRDNSVNLSQKKKQGNAGAESHAAAQEQVSTNQEGTNLYASVPSTPSSNAASPIGKRAAGDDEDTPETMSPRKQSKRPASRRKGVPRRAPDA